MSPRFDSSSWPCPGGGPSMGGQRQEAVAYLVEENRILRAHLRGRVRLTDEERRRLAVTGTGWPSPTPSGRHDRHARHDSSLAPAAHRAEVDVRHSPRRRAFSRRSKARRPDAEHNHHERNHQGLDNDLIHRVDRGQRTHGRIRRRPRLGGLLNFYERAA